MTQTEAKDYKFHFVSDIHLGSQREPNFLLFKNYLESLPEKKVTHLFMMGDIFDLWVADHDFFINEYKAVVDEIKSLITKGIEVHYFEGNHDLHLKKFWRDQIGAYVYDEPMRLEIKGVKMSLAHGDEIDQNDINYLRLRGFFRSKFMTVMAYRLPAFAVRAIGKKADEKSHGHYLRENNDKERIVKLLRNYAEVERQSFAYDYLVSGHFHVRDEFWVEPEKSLAINLGTWLEQPGYFEVSSEGSGFVNLPTSD